MYPLLMTLHVSPTQGLLLGLIISYAAVIMSSVGLFFPHVATVHLDLLRDFTCNYGVSP